MELHRPFNPPFMKLHIVPAQTGFTWVKLGVQAFRRQPMALAALFFLSFVSMSLLASVPVLGNIASLVLLPSVTLAMMVATGESIQGQTPTPALLLVTFRKGRQHLRHMLLLGVLYAVGFLGIMGISALVDGGRFAQVYMDGMPVTQQLASDPSFQKAMWTATLLSLPWSLLFWHAPGLVHWHGIPPVKALFFSLMACVRNVSACLVFLFTWLGIGVVGAMLISVISLALGLGGEAVGSLLVAAAMMMATTILACAVFIFRDCFEPPERLTHEPPQDPQPPTPPAAGQD